MKKLFTLAALVVLAHDRRPVAVEVVELLLHLAFDEGVLLLDHQDVAQAAREHHMAAKPPPPQGPNAAKYAELR